MRPAKNGHKYRVDYSEYKVNRKTGKHTMRDKKSCGYYHSFEKAYECMKHEMQHISNRLVVGEIIPTIGGPNTLGGMAFIQKVSTNVDRMFYLEIIPV
jgi:hypothetical protein